MVHRANKKFGDFYCHDKKQFWVLLRKEICCDIIKKWKLTDAETNFDLRLVLLKQCNLDTLDFKKQTNHYLPEKRLRQIWLESWSCYNLVTDTLRPNFQLLHSLVRYVQDLFPLEMSILFSWKKTSHIKRCLFVSGICSFQSFSYSNASKHL